MTPRTKKKIFLLLLIIPGLTAYVFDIKSRWQKFEDECIQDKGKLLESEYHSGNYCLLPDGNSRNLRP